jgi:hypothetical protein
MLSWHSALALRILPPICQESVLMTATVDREGYRYIPGPFQYSAGVSALPGHAIQRVLFANPVPIAEGFRRIEAILQDANLPLTAFCACELRSPSPFTDAGFIAFNREYVGTLERWGIVANDRNPVARSNVCPEIDPPAAPSFHAFCYVTARYVLGVMEARLAALGGAWSSTTAVQVYTVHNVYPFLATEIVTRGAARHGLTWQFCRPPVVGLEYEMDCRGVATERMIVSPAS